ncbi:hypothetical protein E4U36_003726 [Claviceps purpurea]|nr:hypothetical protein E4U36_003726 [Claviceps purpurea]
MLFRANKANQPSAVDGGHFWNEMGSLIRPLHITTVTVASSLAACSAQYRAPQPPSPVIRKYQSTNARLARSHPPSPVLSDAAPILPFCDTTDPAAVSNLICTVKTQSKSQTLARLLHSRLNHKLPSGKRLRRGNPHHPEASSLTMSAAIAMVPSPAPHERPSFPSTAMHSSSSDTSGSTKSTSSGVHNAPRPSITAASSGSYTPSAALPSIGEATSPRGTVYSPARQSPPGSTRSEATRPKIMVKKEPGSPTLSNMKPRPRRLDLSKNTLSKANNPGSAVPMSARENLGIQEVGIACLSPGFMTQDPVLKEQLQRSMSVREQQRSIIEQRLQQQSAKGDGPSDKDRESAPGFAAKTPGMSRRGKAPPGLSIVAPSHEHFASERIIQSAPLGRSFTGHQQPAPPSRHIANQPSHLSSSSQIHHMPAQQTNNRLPSISDVFGHSATAHSDNAPPVFQRAAPLASPGHHPTHHHHQQAPGSSRSREYKSAEEAQQELAGGRSELLPRIVHYGGRQPPTPPSPAPGSRHAEGSRSANKRRTRAEYEDGTSPPLGHGPPPIRRGPFGEGRDSPEAQRAKKDEFLRLCSRAWDLFHS